MGFIIQNDDPEILKRNLRAANLVKETKLLNIARLAKMLVDLYGLDNQFKRLKKREGQEVELSIPALEGYIRLLLTSDRNKFDVRVEKAKDPVSTIKVKVKEEDILKVLSKIIRSKDNIFGLLKVAKLYLLGKVKIKGSKIAAILLVRSLMIGKDRVYRYKY
ncbi:MAG: hypothetical protein ACFFDK_11485 [Promethearchaeota archaeon]